MVDASTSSCGPETWVFDSSSLESSSAALFLPLSVRVGDERVGVKEDALFALALSAEAVRRFSSSFCDSSRRVARMFE